MPFMPLGFAPGEWDWMNRRRGGGILGPAEGGGLFGGITEKLTSPQAQLGLQLLANSGPSRERRGFGQILGQSALGVQQAQAQQQDNDLRRQYMRAQIGQMRNPRQQNRPGSIQEYEFAKDQGYKGTFQDWVSQGGQSSLPSSVQEWDFYNKLSPQDQKRYLEMKRNPNMMVRDLQGVPNVIAPSVGGTTTTPLSTLPAEAAAASTLAGAQEAGKITGKAEAEAARDLPKTEDRADVLLTNLGRMKTHPGLSGAVGVKGPTSVFGLKSTPIAGSEAANFVAIVDQVGGEMFLQAFQELKGGGHITEIEGIKAEQAMARIRNRDQSESAYRQAIADLEEIVNKGLQRKRAAAVPREQRGATGSWDSSPRLGVGQSAMVSGMKVTRKK